MHARLIFNPAATTTNRAVRDGLVGLLGTAVEVSVVGTQARDHATELARHAVEEGVDAVFALGGDGTANEVLQGVAGSQVPLGILPGGGTNVLARALGLPNDVHRAAAVQLEALMSGQQARSFGLGEANGRLFGFQAGIGFDAGVVRRVESHPGMKRVLRQGAFVLLGLREWATSEDRRDPAAVIEQLDGGDVDDWLEPIAGRRMMIVAGNVDPYTYLARRPFRLTPSASEDSGLDILAVEAMSTVQILRAVARAFGGNGLSSGPGIELRHDVSGLVVRSHRPVGLMVDGDHVGAYDHIVLRHRPDAVRVLAPATAAAGSGQPATDEAA